ncbi:transmembrane protein 51b isoform X1 [Denticeps clupeoides]|uniref:Transmembrane protein 51b n=1 Tax=Denticeps clupeoides TaxID=299321 RepID=A0AAY4EZ56_9TELE|nr:transmembrane protein 51-like isoform X1 [Denticeps clupeoides]XP_028854352.1 transmembrane protein 51-like isoform X1 [Denticeps clupeoides]XP_028854353.1 transmembrane protein 51-like isoform X1 [Denticeps clupeoides]
MCSRGRHLCAGSQQSPSRSTGRRAGSSVSHYALCALGVGMIGLGIVMIVWTVVPLGTNSTYATVVDTAGTTKGTTSSVAFVLVGSGVAMLLLSICLGIRHKRRFQRGENQTAVGNQLMDHIPQQQTEEPAPNYDVPSYEEAVGSGQYPVRQSNLRQSTTHLPSYEDLITAVENEGEAPASSEGPTSPDTGPKPQPASAITAPPRRSSSRASRIFRPLRVRRIVSDKLHQKDFRLKIQSPSQGRVTIEPLTPPPQYEDKPPEF